MPQIIPFRGLRYSPAAGNLEDLLAPPYDVIGASEQRTLAARSPHNAVRLELAEGGDERYEAVAGLLADWQRQGVLRRDDEPMLYVYEQGFTEGGRQLRRASLIAGVEAQPWEEGAVRPHEFTMSGPKEDRLRLLAATKTQLSPVFMVARDRAGQLRQFLDDSMAERSPDVDVTTPDGERHRLWAIEAGRLEMRRIAPLLSETFTIADGHHRYETAVNYKRSLLEAGQTLERDHPARFAMTAIVPADAPGLVIRPIHRIVPRRTPPGWRERLEPNFAIGLAGRDIDDGQAGIVALGLDEAPLVLRPRDEGVYERLAPSGYSPEWTRIQPNLLRYGVLEPLWGLDDDALRAGAVEYTHLADEVRSAASMGGACGFLLQPVGIREMMALAERGERMPQKSTFFYPKLGTGLVFHPLEP